MPGIRARMRRDKCRGARLIGRTSRKSNFERVGEGVGGTCQWCARASVRTRRTVALGYFRRTWYKSRWRSRHVQCVRASLSRNYHCHFPRSRPAGFNDLSTSDTRHETNRLSPGKHCASIVPYRFSSTIRPRFRVWPHPLFTPSLLFINFSSAPNILYTTLRSNVLETALSPFLLHRKQLLLLLLLLLILDNPCLQLQISFHS